MSSEIRMDLSEVVALARDLEGAPRRCLEAVEPVVRRGALNVKRNAFWRAQALIVRGYAQHYPYSIGYDLFTGPRRVAAEIGPDKDKPQGALGNLIEYGSANNAPLPHLGPAGAQEAPRFEKNLLKAAAKAVLP